MTLERSIAKINANTKIDSVEHRLFSVLNRTSHAVYCGEHITSELFYVGEKGSISSYVYRFNDETYQIHIGPRHRAYVVEACTPNRTIRPGYGSKLYKAIMDGLAKRMDLTICS